MQEIRDASTADVKVNLDQVDLRNYNLAYLDLEGFSFVRANLEGAMLSGANLQHADFTQANLTGIANWNGDMSGARFDQAILHQAKFVNVTLTDSTIENAGDKRVQEFKVNGLSPEQAKQFRE